MKYVIGDIKGCFDELQAMLKLIAFNSDKDELWLVGDLINRGPKSVETLRFLKTLPSSSCKIVLGNHDTHMLTVACGAIPSAKGDTLKEILEAPDCEELCTWLRQRPFIHYDEELDTLMAHAGILPTWTRQQAMAYATELHQALQGENYREVLTHLCSDKPEQWSENLTGWDRLCFISNCLTRMRFCSSDGKLEFKMKDFPPAPTTTGYQPWFNIEPRASAPTRIVFGHWAALAGKTHRTDIISLDTGCVWGHELTAMRLEDGQRFQVKRLRHSV